MNVLAESKIIHLSVREGGLGRLRGGDGGGGACACGSGGGGGLGGGVAAVFA